MKLYHMPGSRSGRVIWVFEELGMPYELVTKAREELKKPDYLAIHPLGTVPVLIEDGRSMFESCAIVEYLVDRFGKGVLAPATEQPARAPYLQWLHFGEESLMPPMSQYIMAAGLFGGGQRNEAAIQLAQSRMQPVMSFLERHLERHTYLTGATFNAADIVTSWNLFVGKRFDLLGDWPAMNAYLDRLRQRPACIKALSPLL